MLKPMTMALFGLNQWTQLMLRSLTLLTTVEKAAFFAYFVFDKNPLMLKTTALHIDNVCYFGCESDTTNKTIEFLEKFKVRVSLAKECHKFKFNTEHHETLMHETIKTLKTIYEEHNDMDAKSYLNTMTQLI